jgi:hypothetical protein
MSKIKNIAIAMMALVAAFFAASVEPAAAQERRMLGDHSAEAVEEARKDVNDASILDIKDRYADVALAFDGNVTTVGGGAIKVVAQDKADQGISLGLVAGGEVYGENFSPIGGIAGAYQFRRIRLGLEGTIGVGKPDKLSDDQSKFVEFNGFGDVAVEVFRSKSLKHSFLIGGYACFKASKNSVVVENENGSYFWDKTNAFNVGGGGSLMYIYSPEWNSISHVFQLRVGANHKLHTEKEGSTSEFSFGGKKAYLQVGLTYKIMFGLGKRHTKSYNDALKNKGYSEKQMRSMVGLK